METFKSFHDLETHQVGGVTIGNFDGFHLGHQSLIQALKRATAERPCLLITFDPHPREVLSPGIQVPRLSEWDELLENFEKSGVDLVLRLTFDERLKNTSARDFMAQLWSAAPFTSLVVGHDFALGSQREGDASYLAHWSQEKNVSFLRVSPFELGGEIVSSQRIREALIKGDVKKAAQLLGRPFRLSGLVVKGDARGRTLNFPTANLKVSNQLIRPAFGVYGGRSFIKGKVYDSVCNIGRRPTFKNQDDITIEVHILNFSDEIYDETLDFEFLFRIREEKKFDSKEELIKQIHKDILSAKERF